VEGSGVIHFHQGLTTEFYEQLTSEKKQVRYSKGYAISEWVKISSKRNEALDCFVYAYAALNELYQKYDKRTMWEQFAKKQQVEPVESVQAPVAAPPVPPTKPPKRRPANPKSFITNW
jgi:phage terminase large subunit GpA-like protein